MVKNGKIHKRKSLFKTSNGRLLDNEIVSPLHTPVDWSKIDPGIEYELRILRDNGIETTESCQGGQGHPFPEPTIRFCGGRAAGFKAVGIAITYGLKMSELRRVWDMQDGELTGPQWEITFYALHSGLGGRAKSVPKQDGSGTVTWKWG